MTHATNCVRKITLYIITYFRYKKGEHDLLGKKKRNHVSIAVQEVIEAHDFCHLMLVKGGTFFLVFKNSVFYSKNPFKHKRTNKSFTKTSTLSFASCFAYRSLKTVEVVLFNMLLNRPEPFSSMTCSTRTKTLVCF